VTSKPRITPVPSSVHTSDDQPAHDTTGRPPGGSLSREGWPASWPSTAATSQKTKRSPPASSSARPCCA